MGNLPSHWLYYKGTYVSELVVNIVNGNFQFTNQNDGCDDYSIVDTGYKRGLKSHCTYWESFDGGDLHHRISSCRRIAIGRSR